ncbi:MAG: hypothetical protein HC910_21520 [Spirulinaceae cyanobacterium SM2_1_0]|nr:hypothetical protein [Spirulinaceae cyanobacterium SM2_1_0]
MTFDLGTVAQIFALAIGFGTLIWRASKIEGRLYQSLQRQEAQNQRELSKIEGQIQLLSQQRKSSTELMDVRLSGIEERLLGKIALQTQKISELQGYLHTHHDFMPRRTGDLPESL